MEREKEVLVTQLITRSTASEVDNEGTYEPSKGYKGWSDERYTGIECKIKGTNIIEVGQQTSWKELKGILTGETNKRLGKILKEGETNSSWVLVETIRLPFKERIFLSQAEVKQEEEDDLLKAERIFERLTKSENGVATVRSADFGYEILKEKVLCLDNDRRYW